MRSGDWDAAWALDDGVLARRDPALRDDPLLDYHLRWVWDGRPFRGRDVLVRCYHGLGDTLQFARFLPALRRLAASLTVEVQPELLPLMRTVAGPDRLIPFLHAAPASASPCDIEIMELAHALRLRPDAAPPPYLRAPPGARQTARREAARKLPADAIGLCWQAGGWDPARSVPVALLAPLFGHRPVLALQPGPVPAGLAVLDPLGAPAAVADTAGLIATLDLIITVDSMVAHLAGALGRPTWLLLRHDCDWRWMGDGAASRWYPSMRLYRQPAPGDWHSVIRAVAADLRAAG